MKHFRNVWPCYQRFRNSWEQNFRVTMYLITNAIFLSSCLRRNRKRSIRDFILSYLYHRLCTICCILKCSDQDYLIAFTTILQSKTVISKVFLSQKQKQKTLWSGACITRGNSQWGGIIKFSDVLHILSLFVDRLSNKKDRKPSK